MAEKVIDEQLEGNLGPAVAILNLSRLIIHNSDAPVHLVQSVDAPAGQNIDRPNPL